MNPNNTISAVIITKNESPRIKRCLKSVSWADEIIVIDNGSTDDTVKQAADSGARIVRFPGNDFSGIRNMGKYEAKNAWVLYVDADEEVTRQLQKEITGIINSENERIPDAFYIRRRNYYLGQKWPADDRMLRLFRKESLVGWYGRLHETADVKGRTGRLDSALIHRTHRTLEEMVAKTNNWSETEAELRLTNGHPAVVWWRILRVMTTGFYEYYVRQSGWKAGTVGLIESIYQAFSMFVTYAKLWEKQHKPAIV